MATKHAVLLGLAWCALHAPALDAQIPRELKAPAALAAEWERAEWETRPGDDASLFLPLSVVEGNLEEVAAYLRRHPGNAAARVLSVRLGRIRDAVAYQAAVIRAMTEPGGAFPELPSHRSYLALLDRVIAEELAPSEALYWRGRLTLEEGARGADRSGPPYDGARAGAEAVTEALRYARGALALEPGEPRYRELVGWVLTLDGRYADAVATLDHPSTAGRLMHRLVEDLGAFAPPEEAERDPMLATLGWQVWWMSTGGGTDKAVLGQRRVRVAAWSLPATVDDLRAHYQRSWPEARFPEFEFDYASRFVYREGEWRVEERRPEGAPRPDRPDDVVVVILVTPRGYGEFEEACRVEGLPATALPGERAGILYLNLRRDPSLVTLVARGLGRAALPVRGG